MRGSGRSSTKLNIIEDDDPRQPVLGTKEQSASILEVERQPRCCRKDPLFPCSQEKLVGFAVAAGLLLFTVLLFSKGSGFKGYPIKFLVVGDWGRKGQLNQTEVANMMALKASTVQPDFIISVGDNFYPSGLSSPQDEAFSTSFTEVYSDIALQVPWYAVLGNHDYGDKCYDEPPGCTPTGELYYSPNHQMDNALAKRDARWKCGRTYEMLLAAGRVHLFFIDTSPFVQKYYERNWANFTGGLTEQSWQQQLEDLEPRLAASRAEWKLVVGHHPPRSNGHHNNTEELIQHLEPLLQAAGVQAYFAGHDHNLEHIKVPGALPNYLITGGGSKTERPFLARTDSLFQWPSSGFVSVELAREEMTVEYLGYRGNAPGDNMDPMYVAKISRDEASPPRRTHSRALASSF